MRERLIGALVLVAIVVLLVPAVLKGRDARQEARDARPTRSVELRLGDEEPREQDEVLVPEEVAAEKPQAPARIEDPPAAVVERRLSVPPDAADDPVERAPDVASRNVDRDPAPVARASSESPAWAVQLGAFSTPDKAEDLVAELRRRGYAAFVLEYRATGKVLHRVRVGPEQDRSRADAIAQRLRKDGFDPVVARHP